MNVLQINQFITRWGLRPDQVLRQASGKYDLPQHLFRIQRQALDVRSKRPRAVYTLEVPYTEKTRSLETRPEVRLITVRSLQDELAQVTPNPRHCPLIVGMGPAGLFAAMTYAEAGLQPIILERGKPVEDREQDVNRLWQEDSLDEESNPLFGEGGAGTFSDGKLNTRINDPLVRYILEKLAAFGARDRILTDAKPHIGTDRLIKVMQEARTWLIERGVQIRFGTRMTGFTGTPDGIVLHTSTGEDITGSWALLALGHSARDSYTMLADAGVAMEAKPFAVGARIEHPQELMDNIMYGKNTRNQFGLPPVSYQFAWNGEKGTGCYTFCMCPGGEIILTVNEAGTLCVNGMSNSKRNSPFANAAVVGKVPVAAYDRGHVLDGIRFQRELEERGYQMGVPGFMAPAQPVSDFLAGTMPRRKLPSSYANGTYAYPLHELLPEFVTEQMRNGLKEFNGRARGFTGEEANLVGIETRTSAPVRIVRDPETGRSVSHERIFPCGEGSGYAGGIVSAALDGMRAAIRSMS